MFVGLKNPSGIDPLHVPVVDQGPQYRFNGPASDTAHLPGSAAPMEFGVHAVIIFLVYAVGNLLILMRLEAALQKGAVPAHSLSAPVNALRMSLVCTKPSEG